MMEIFLGISITLNLVLFIAYVNEKRKRIPKEAYNEMINFIRDLNPPRGGSEAIKIDPPHRTFVSTAGKREKIFRR